MNDIITSLREYFEGRADVAMAFLFGSGARGQAGPDSDIDVAVYFTSEAMGRWSEEDREFPGELELGMDLERIIEKEVDLLVLNRAFPTVADSALRGIPIVIRDRGTYLNFLMRTVSEAIDFRGFIESWWQLKESRRHETASGR